MNDKILTPYGIRSMFYVKKLVNRGSKSIDAGWYFGYRTNTDAHGHHYSLEGCEDFDITRDHISHVSEVPKNPNQV